MRIMSGFFYIFLKTYFTYLIFSAFFVIMFSGGTNLTTKNSLYSQIYIYFGGNN